LVLVLGAVELACSFLPAESLDTRSLRLRAQTMDDNLIASNEVPGWDLRPDGGEVAHIRYTTNRWRMRGPDYPDPRPAEAGRVIMVGDSTIFGVKLEWEQTFTAEFARQRAEGKRPELVQVANCASPGHSTYQSKMKLARHCLAFEPDVVVIGNQNSDSAFDVGTDRDRFPPRRFPGLYDLLDRSSLYRAVSTLVVRSKDRARLKAQTEGTQIAQVGGPTGSIVRVSLEDYRENLLEMIGLVRASGALPVLLVLPDITDVTDQAPPPGSNLAAYKDTLRALAASEGVQLVDAQEWFRFVLSGQDVFIDVVHPNERGAAVLGDLLHRHLPSPLPRRGAAAGG
jgi:hypothetical protein